MQSNFQFVFDMFICFITMSSRQCAVDKQTTCSRQRAVDNVQQTTCSSQCEVDNAQQTSRQCTVDKYTMRSREVDNAHQTSRQCALDKQTMRSRQVDNAQQTMHRRQVDNAHQTSRQCAVDKKTMHSRQCAFQTFVSKQIHEHAEITFQDYVKQSKRIVKQLLRR